MKFERAAFSDAEELARLEEENFADPWNRRMIEEELVNPSFGFYKMTDRDTICAYAGYWMLGDEADIGTVCVSAPFRKRGIGTELLQKVFFVMKAEGIRRAALEVRVTNAAARALYQKLGFTAAGIRPGYYGDGEDAVVMWLSL